MDPRFLHRHHDPHSSRYAPLPHLPPPPHPPPPPSTPRLHFSDVQIFRSPHTHHLPQPQPQPQPQHVPHLPPSCQPLPPRPPPPPPPQQQEQHHYNPTPPHFPISYARPLQDFVQSSRMVDRLNPRLPRRDDFWEPSTVLSDAHRPPTRPFHLHLGFDLDRNEGPPHQRLPINKLRHDPQGSSRSRVESKDGFDPNKKDDNFAWGRGDENYHRIGHYLSNSDSTSRDLEFVSNSRNIESTLGDFDHRFGSVRDIEGYRGVRNDGGHDRQASRDIGDLLYEMGNSKTEDGEGVRISSVKREYNGLDGRYNHNRGSREGSHEYSRTPWKQVQKKSAFLRIQMAKPNHRSRESEQLHYSGYFDKGNSGSFRGKDQFVHLGHGMEEREDKRGGSPVELDVSFKSNSLVAKAIVAPSSSAVVSDMNMIPRYQKTRKVSDGDCSNSQRSKFSETAVNLDGSTCAAKKISNSEEDLKQLEEKVTTSDIGNVCNSSSQPCSRRTSDSLGKSKGEKSPKGLVSDKDGTNVGSGRTAPKIVKKKKVVKKMVKKFVKPQSLLSSSLQTKKRDEPAKTDSSTHRPPADLQYEKDATERLVTSDGMASRHNVDLQARTDRVSVLPEDGIADRSLLTAASHDCGVNSDRASVTKIRKNWKSSTYPLGSLSCEGNRTNESPINNSVHLHGTSNSDKELIKPLTEITLSDIGHVKDVSKLFNLSGLLLPLETDAKKKATRTVLPLKDNANANSSLLSLEEIKAHKDISHTYITPHDTSKKLGVENCIHKSQENTAASSVGIRDTIRKQPCTNQFSTSLENTIPEGIHQTLAGSSTIVGFYSSKKTKIHNNHVYAGCLNHGRDTTWNSDDGCTSLEEKITLCNSGNISYTGKHTAPSRAAISLENCPLERYPNGLDGARASEGKMHSIKKRRKMRTQSDFSNSPNIHVDRVTDVVSPANALDATLDFSPAEVTVSGVGSLDIGLQPGRDGASVLQANSLAEGFSGVKLTMNSTINNLNGTSPRYKRKREISSTDLAWSSPTLSKINEVPAGTTISCADMSLINNDDLAQPEEEAAMSSINNSTSGMVPCPNGTAVFVDNAFGVRSSEAVGAARDVFTANSLKVPQQGVESFSSAKDPNAQSPCPPGLGRKQKENSTPLMAFNVGQNDNMDIETSDEEKMDAKAAEDQGFIHAETQCKISSEPQSPDLDQRFSSGDMESDYPLVKDDLPSVSNSQSLSDDGAGFSSPNINDELMDMCSQETLSEVPSIVMLNGKASPGQISNEKVCGEGGSGVSANTAFSRYAKQDLATQTDHSIIEKTVLLPSQDSKISSRSLTSAVSIGKTQRGSSIPRVFPGHSPFVLINSKKAGSSARIAKPRTWHRTGPALPVPVNKTFSNSIPPKRQLENNLKSQSTSYIRKGNSLVRKPAPVASQHQPSHCLGSSVYRAIYSGLDESKKSSEYHSRAGVTDPQNLLTLGIHTPLERPRTPPLPGGTKSSPQTAISSGYNTSSPLAEGPSGCSETTSDPVNSTETNNVLESAGDPLKISENLTGTSNNLESQAELNDRSMASFNKRRIVYVKRKSNQLVATSNSSDLSVHSGNNNQAASDGYYKRRKNQLIRASLENQIKKSVVMPDDLLRSGGKLVPKVVSSRKFSMRRLHKVVAKTCKPVKSSLVWTLCGKQALKNDSGALDHQKVLPYRFPWKRATYCRSFMHNEVSSSNNSSLSMISRKLLLLRKRDTVYTRSINGFSLRKFKVLSVGGSSLKWSKSIERNSKKANEEATLAVAAVEKKKREQSGVACSSSQTKNRNHSSRERIFRIGLLRYKMDSTKQTLQRITDDESTCSTSQTEKDAKKSYIPRRLVIGNDEYVRIGNGNQLIRDPKKRTRILASEKVRWSLHTARLRLARKKKYCQFFTRFGKCNKGDGKCPYIHDPSKVAVCTKFLNGLCSNPNCKLTHKVIPERMPDCSYFLQGLCTNRYCPYRHVNVNPKASTCDGFLRGYCADGNECRKKHSYVCPIFEATGTCPQGSKCKLHHPKSRSKGKKRKRLGQRKNARGRYFGSMPINVSEPRAPVHEKISTQNNDDILSEGKLADYISLDVSDEDVGESNDPTVEQTFYESESSDEQLDELDELIKPVRIMKNNLTT